jgi:hypothetical protein
MRNPTVEVQPEASRIPAEWCVTLACSACPATVTQAAEEGCVDLGRLHGWTYDGTWRCPACVKTAAKALKCGAGD